MSYSLTNLTFVQLSELQDKLTASETEIAELKNKFDDLEYMHEKSQNKCDSYERKLQEMSEKLQFYQETTGSMPNSALKNVPGVPTGRVSSFIKLLKDSKCSA